MRTFSVTATWESSHQVDIEDDALEGEALRDAILDHTDSSTASLVDWTIKED